MLTAGVHYEGHELGVHDDVATADVCRRPLNDSESMTLFLPRRFTACERAMCDADHEFRQVARQCQYSACISRAEITATFAKSYGKASKKCRALISDQVMPVTG
ncbi:hypothetical protein MHEL_39760 [Mycolicibacterium helvum]|uniref:Uncharacterized protein n=1 Tax=Mycolicibacterium helvum TaxID=1534349 RepID=A0A7I7TA86_9MYCO|nr:hypothetical protein MHEL_39760 [Mycolicibacterium helvum]